MNQEQWTRFTLSWIHGHAGAIQSHRTGPNSSQETTRLASSPEEDHAHGMCPKSHPDSDERKEQIRRSNSIGGNAVPTGCVSEEGSMRASQEKKERPWQSYRDTAFNLDGSSRGREGMFGRSLC